MPKEGVGMNPERRDEPKQDKVQKYKCSYEPRQECGNIPRKTKTRQGSKV